MRCHSCHNQIVKNRLEEDSPKENPAHCCQMDRGRVPTTSRQARRETRSLAICFIREGRLRSLDETMNIRSVAWLSRGKRRIWWKSPPERLRSLAGNGLRFP